MRIHVGNYKRNAHLLEHTSQILETVLFAFLAALGLPGLGGLFFLAVVRGFTLWWSLQAGHRL